MKTAQSAKNHHVGGYCQPRISHFDESERKNKTLSLIPPFSVGKAECIRKPITGKK